jgi:hypothetical protein
MVEGRSGPLKDGTGSIPLARRVEVVQSAVGGAPALSRAQLPTTD